MKKSSIICIFVLSLFVTTSVFASSFKFDPLKLFSNDNSKNNLIINNFDKNYELSHSINEAESDEELVIKDLTKKITYLLLGDFNSKNESSEDFYKRKNDFFDLGAFNYYPKDENTKSYYDESKPSYIYAQASELALPNAFNSLNKYDIQYNSYGDIRIEFGDLLVKSTIVLNDVKYKSENENKSEYVIEKTNVILYYYFMKIDGEYRIAIISVDSTDDLDNFFNSTIESETKNTKSIALSYSADLSLVYNFDKLNALTENDINNVYETNKTNVIYLRSYYNNKIVTSANGVFINDGIVLTTWSFIEKSLINSQYITIRDNNNILYNMDGLITANPDTDVAVIKLKEKTGNYVKLSSDEINIEDPVITLNSKFGVGLSIQKGIVLSNKDYINTSIPLLETDQGSPLFDKNGNMIGLNTAKSINSSVSIAINKKIIKEIQDKFANIDFNSINTISFDKLKSEYYYVKFNQENAINNISNSKWNKYKNIGNIENNIKLELVKANYKNGIVSLRYKNNINDFIPSMNFALSFKEQLINDGYKETMSSSSKYIYSNEDYKIVIMSEFDYLIIVMVEL